MQNKQTHKNKQSQRHDRYFIPEWWWPSIRILKYHTKGIKDKGLWKKKLVSQGLAEKKWLLESQTDPKCYFDIDMNIK